MGHFCKGGKWSEDSGWPEFDARGIYLTKVCEECEEEKLTSYRKEVLSDPNYEADERIDEE